MRFVVFVVLLIASRVFRKFQIFFMHFQWPPLAECPFQ
jgi:hypothetical protein